MMFLKDYFSNLNPKYFDKTFTGISFNSNDIKKGYIFFAIKGNKINGNFFIKHAIKKGANIIISNKHKDVIKNNILYLYAKNPRKLLANFSNKLYQKKPNNIIAVTGTNGKSSIVDFYYQILNLNNIKVSSIGTLGIKGLNNNSNSTNTTLDSIQINKILQNLKKKKIENVILEASSHGLKQHRLDGLKFDTGIFTNLTRDHLDYHKTFSDYFNSKLILFNKLMKKNSNIIFDNESEISNKLNKISKKNNLKKINIGSKNTYLKIINHRFINQKQEVKINIHNKVYRFSTNLIGKIQIKNLLMSVLAAYKSNLKLSKIIRVIEKVNSVPGRLEKIGILKNNAMVILDYAHTPDALKICLENIIEQFNLKKINLVFGCGGDRDKLKRRIMGKIANKYCNKIYLTDDNPRNENPKLIRKQIKKAISKNKLIEIGSRRLAIKKAINELACDELLIVAGKGHETFQEYKDKKYFSDKKCIISSIKNKNKKISKNWKINIMSENLNRKINPNIIVRNASINSKKINKNDVFFGIKGKRIDGNKFADEAINNGSSLSIIDKFFGKKNKKKLIVKNSLKYFTKCAEKVRSSSNIFALAITGSSGKTSLKELLGQTLSKIKPTTYSNKSFNNKYGVPISLFNINKKDKFGVFEVGMNKKKEIYNLSKIIKPNIGIITNVSYAHIENFKNLNGIANAKSEIIDNIIKNGSLVINADDNYFNFFKKKAEQKGLEVISFSKKNKSNVMLKKIFRKKNSLILLININGTFKKFKIKKSLESYLYNILACVAVISKLINLDQINEKIFYDYKLPEGRGDYKLIHINKKKIKLVDESYNSNPASLEFALKSFDRIKTNSKKIVLLGDMLELGSFSKKLHIEVARSINNTKINKVYAYGKNIIYTFNKIRTQKRAKLLKSKKDIFDFLQNDINNGDYLMVKGSNSTGLNSLVSKLKLGKVNAL